jgi:hypothetical protein
MIERSKTMARLNNFYKDDNGVTTLDTWLIPNEGAFILTSALQQPVYIRPLEIDDTLFVIQGEVYTGYHVMRILNGIMRKGGFWELKDIKMTRYKNIDKEWKKVEVW